MGVYKHIGGARLWCDWGLFPAPLKDRLWEFIGTGNFKGEIVWQFIPHKRAGNPKVMTYDQLSRLNPYFKPFCVSTDSFFMELNGGESVEK